MKFHYALAIVGALTGAAFVIAFQVARERWRYRRVQRALPGIWWWYHWLSMWGFIGLTEVVTRTNLPDITVDHEALDAIMLDTSAVTRRTSATWSPETPIWSDYDQYWVESDVQLRARIKGGR